MSSSCGKLPKYCDWHHCRLKIDVKYKTNNMEKIDKYSQNDDKLSTIIFWFFFRLKKVHSCQIKNLVGWERKKNDFLAHQFEWLGWVVQVEKLRFDFERFQFFHFLPSAQSFFSNVADIQLYHENTFQLTNWVCLGESFAIEVPNSESTARVSCKDIN